VKKRWIQFIAGLSLFILCIAVCTTTANATVVWQDDFSDPNLPGWTILGWSNTTTSYEIIEGNFSAESGKLEVLDDDINIARHDSNVSVGTWSFDMFIPNDGTSCYVYFMSNGSRPIVEFPTRFLAIGVFYDWDEFIVMEVYEYSWAILSHINVEDIPADSLSGWHHIDVSRTSDSHFYVYFNETLIDDFVGISVTNSTYLEFFCNNVTGAVIDNLEVTTTATTTDGITPPPDGTTFLIIAGVGITVFVIVLVMLFARRR